MPELTKRQAKDLEAALRVKRAEEIAHTLKWKRADDALQEAKAIELALRQAAIAAVFPRDIGDHAGTTNAELADGSVLKSVVRKNAKVDQAKIGSALARLRALGEAGALLADRLVKWSAEASIGEWNKLSDEQREIFADIITIVLGQPALELIPAK